MPIGNRPEPEQAQVTGKYDDACTAARIATEARAVVLVVIGGRDGSGFSVQGLGDTPALFPQLLRDMANEIEAAQQERLGVLSEQDRGYRDDRET
jgi:hypothetical protein